MGRAPALGTVDVELIKTKEQLSYFVSFKIPAKFAISLLSFVIDTKKKLLKFSRIKPEDTCDRMAGRD